MSLAPRLGIAGARQRPSLQYSSHDEESYKHTFESQQRNMLQGGRNAHRQAYMHSFTKSSFFLGCHAIVQTALATQPKLYDACDTVRQSVLLSVQNCLGGHRCTYTTVPLVPRRNLVRFDQHRIIIPLCLTESGRPACTDCTQLRSSRKRPKVTWVASQERENRVS